MIRIETDKVIQALKPHENLDDLRRLLSLLCGEDIPALENEAKETVEEILSRCRADGPENVEISYEEFNELLLMFDQDRVERPFFEFFFLQTDARPKRTTIVFSDLRTGVSRFRGFAMLCFGNFRFAYRKLRTIRDAEEFTRELRPWNADSKRVKLELQGRRRPLVSLIGTQDYIPEKQTWYLGYLTRDLLFSDSALLKCMYGKSRGSSLDEVLEVTEDKQLAAMIKDKWSAITSQDVRDFRRTFDFEALDANANRMISGAERALKKGIRNTLKYLTWDYLDVYLATSMRQEWEFVETHRFVRAVFEQRLKKLPLRWFDPTQSYDVNLVDKGLLEGLMLKRAKCTIYMAQEGDTLGKDSELAATLAQGKPVIAYVREIKDLKREAKEMRTRPLRYFRQRLLFLAADLFFEKADNIRKVTENLQALKHPLAGRSMREIVEPYVKFLYDIEGPRKFALISDEEKHLRRKHKDRFKQIQSFMAAVEKVAADNRAETIRARHPLSMQVHLQTGVANGVLVVRSYDACAAVVENILMRSLSFEIDVLKDRKDRALGDILVEKATQSKFRVVTRNTCLTNSFWNFYLDS